MGLGGADRWIRVGRWLFLLGLAVASVGLLLLLDPASWPPWYYLLLAP